MTFSQSFSKWRTERPPLVGRRPLVVLCVMVAAFFVLPALSGKSTGSFNVYDVFQNFADVGLVALALGVTMIAGEFDLSVVGMYGLGAMVAVKSGVSSPVVGVLLAVVVGAIVGLAQGTIVARLRMNSMTVTLGGYLILLGLTGTLGHNGDIQYTNFGVGAALDKTIATVFSWRSLIVIAIFLAVAALLRYTRGGRDLRSIGGDRRASRTAGVRVDRYLIVMFMMSGVLCGLGGALHGYSVATAVPNPGLSPLLYAITAALLGGVSLAGGRGRALGIAAGALALSLLTELFAILATPQYVSDLVTGGLLVLVTVATAPHLLRYWKTVRPVAQTPVVEPPSSDPRVGRSASAPPAAVRGDARTQK